MIDSRGCVMLRFESPANCCDQRLENLIENLRLNGSELKLSPSGALSAEHLLREQRQSWYRCWSVWGCVLVALGRITLLEDGLNFPSSQCKVFEII